MSTPMETRPMKASELGRYVCVAHGGCQHSPRITITSDGVWVKVPDSLNPGGHMYTSAHRDCCERWQAAEAANDWRRDITAGKVVTESTLHGDREILVATQPDPRGNYEGHIIYGADSSRPRELFSFNTATARFCRIATPDDHAQAGLTPG